jgi:class 3 adenylate cyclase
MREIERWLAGIGLEQYGPLFVDEAIELAVLPDLHDGDLKNLDIPLGHRKRILRAIGELRGAVVPTTPVRDGLSADRRHITVLFCDLVGSTQMSTVLDPEDLTELLNGYRRYCSETIARWHGYVAKYMGDGVLAYFGWPRAHEDDVETAVRAGLELSTGVRLLETGSRVRLATRIGIATGEVVVGDTIGEGAAQEHSVVGETPNRAARMQALAQVDAVMIDARTRELLGNLFEFRDMGQLEIKGFAERMSAYEVIRASATPNRFEAMHPRQTPLVGRNEEIGALSRRWEQAAQGEGQVVMISGEPGIGKSRTVAALFERFADGRHVRLRLFCSPYHVESALHPFIAQLENAAGFASGDSPEIRFAKLAAVLDPSSGRSDDKAVLAELLSIPAGEYYQPLVLGAEQKKERTLAALIGQFVAIAAANKVLMVFEDIHWIDPTSRALLERIVGLVERLPVLLVLTFRPEFQPPWLGLSHVSMHMLRKLNRRESTTLVDHLTGGKKLPPEVAERVIAHTDGVPLFMEELTKTVLEANLLTEEADRYVLSGPLPPLAIPTSLQASLMARLDRLASLKDLAQIGAAIGREFSLELLAAVTGNDEGDLQAALDQLVDAGLLFRHDNGTRAILMFKHALVRDAAYASLLRGRRQQLHARIAQVIESEFPALAAAEPEIVAHHLTEAASNAAAARWWGRAGAQSLRRAANPEAAAQLLRARALLAKEPPSRERDERELELLVDLGPALINTCGWNSQEVKEVYTRALEIARVLDKPDALLASLVGGWATFHLGGRYREALSVADETERLAQASSNGAAMLQAHHLAFPPLLYLGEIARCRRHIADMLDLYDEVAYHEHRFVYMNHDPAVCGHAVGAMAAWCAGDIDQAWQSVARADSLARRLGHVPSLAHALYFNANFCVLALNAERVLAMSEEVLALARGVKLAPAEASAQSFKGWALIERGEIDEGIRLTAAGLAAWRAQGHQLLMPHRLCLHAEGLTKAGRLNEASAVVGEALELIDRNEEKAMTPLVLMAQAEILLARGEVEDAERALVHALQAANQVGIRPLALRAGTRAAHLRADRADRDGARALLVPLVGHTLPSETGNCDLDNANVLLAALGSG